MPGNLNKNINIIIYCKGSDGIITRIPNGQIIHQRVQNLSRLDTSNIKQTLWFRYNDINKLPNVLESIKNEIILSCPKLINDGSRKFNALWIDYQHDHLTVLVDASFNIEPTSNEYSINKQVMLQAIAKAVQKHNVEFAIPTSLCLSADSTSSSSTTTDTTANNVDDKDKVQVLA